MNYNREKASVLFDEIMPLLKQHYEEIAHYKDIELKPDFEHYQRCEDAGILRCFTNRKENGELIGYAVFFVKYNMHYKDSLQAGQDILFIKKEHRGFGARFILWCDEQLKSEGVQVVYHHVKEAHNFGKLLERLEYQLVDLIYSRRLD